MNSLKRFYRTFLRLSLTAAIILPLVVYADSKSKLDMTEKLEDTGYLQKVKHQADALYSLANSQIAGWGGGVVFPTVAGQEAKMIYQDPKWYGGNSLVEAAIAPFEDLLANLGVSDFPNIFLGCLDFKIEGKCFKGSSVGFEVSYRWPVQQIHSRRFFQNRYIPDFAYSLLKASGYYENVHYWAVKNLHAPLALTHAELQLVQRMNQKSWTPYIPYHGAILPQFKWKDGSDGVFPLEKPAERARYDGGKIGDSELNQLEYTLGPTLLQAAWVVIVNYFPPLKLLPGSPPKKLPAPFGSDDPMMIEFTRNPFLGFSLYKDKSIKKDLKEWVKNPGICQEWMMNKKKKNIPYDLYQANPDLLENPLSWIISAVPKSDLLVPLPSSKLSKFNRMCTKNWGGSIPFTTVHQVHDTGFVDAGKNFEKAIRLGVGIYETYIKNTQAGTYIKYYKFNKKEDAYQLTYPEVWDCKKVGEPGKVFPASAHAYHVPEEHGLYSMTHWKRLGSSCMDVGKAVKAITEIWDMELPDLSGLGEDLKIPGFGEGDDN